VRKSAAQKQQEQDDAAVERTRQRFGDAEAAILNRELIIKRTEPGGSWQSKLPVPLLILTGLLLFVFEVVAKAPEFFLAYGRFQATQAEYDAKLLQPATAKAQLDRAEAEAITARAAADIAKALTTAQLSKAQDDARTATIQPELATAQLQNARLEAQNRALQPQLTQMQIAKLGLDTQVVIATLPNTQASAAITQQMLQIMGPWMGVLGGAIPQPQQQPPAPEAAVVQSIPRGAPPAAQRQQQPQPATLSLPAGTPEGDYVRGSSDAQKWSAFLAGSEPDVREGSEFWVSVKDKPAGHSCSEGKGATNAGFKRGCETARERFADVDRQFKANPNYRAGWSSVR
jgi:hypothetical protein